MDGRGNTKEATGPFDRPVWDGKRIHMKKRYKIRIVVFLCLSGLLAVGVALLFYCGVWHFNNPSPDEYPVRGVDVSSYQGDIDWAVLSGQGIEFAFIKATEGSSFVDECFEKNWANACETDLSIGAYHFFSFESSGRAQAENFISTVGPLEDTMLPPVIDIEYYDYPSGTDVSARTVQKELGEMIETLKAYYGRPPVLYVTKRSYNDFVQGHFTECPLWVRSVYGRPDYVSDQAWAFWQYSNRHRLNGYEGKEPYIDMNVYNGDLKGFLQQFSLPAA